MLLYLTDEIYCRGPDKLIKVVDFLNEKVAAGEFEFSDSESCWEDNENIIKLLGLGHDCGEYYFGEALAYINQQRK